MKGTGTEQNKKDKDVAKELLSTLSAFEKILKQEIQTCAKASRRASTGKGA